MRAQHPAVVPALAACAMEVCGCSRLCRLCRSQRDLVSRKYGQQPRGPAPASGNKPGGSAYAPVRPGPRSAGTVQTQGVSTDKRHLASPSVPGEASLSLTRCHSGRRDGGKSKTMPSSRDSALTWKSAGWWTGQVLVTSPGKSTVSLP